MRKFLVSVAVVGALSASLAATTRVVASAQTATGTVTVVHGLRGVVADVYLDGTLALPAFQPERVTDPIAVPAGPHRVEIRLAGAPATDPPAVTGDVVVTADARQSIVAHLDSAGNPAITAYMDDATPVPAGDARAIIRHTAAAPPVDVSLNDSVVAPALTEPGSASADVPAASYQVSVWSPGTRDAVVAPQMANLSEGAATVMYLIGSAQAGTLSWIAEQVPDIATPPSRIQTGDSGLAADPAPGRFPLVPVLGGIGGAAAVAAVVALVASRRSRLA
jgi:Domain of unknown function (DUF4397)